MGKFTVQLQGGKKRDRVDKRVVETVQIRRQHFWVDRLSLKIPLGCDATRLRRSAKMLTTYLPLFKKKKQIKIANQSKAVSTIHFYHADESDFDRNPS